MRSRNTPIAWPSGSFSCVADFNPDSLTERAHAQYAEGNGLRDMVFENLVAERIAIDSYREIVQYIGDKDPHHPAHLRRHPGAGRRARR